MFRAFFLSELSFIRASKFLTEQLQTLNAGFALSVPALGFRVLQA